MGLKTNGYLFHKTRQTPHKATFYLQRTGRRNHICPGIIITKLPEAGIIKKNFCRKNIGSCYNQRKIGYHCSHGLLAKGDLA